MTNQKNQKNQTRADIITAVRHGRLIQQGLEFCHEISTSPVTALLRDDQITALKGALESAEKYPEFKDPTIFGMDSVHYTVAIENMRRIYNTYTNPALVKSGIEYLKALDKRGLLLADWSPYRKQIKAVRGKK